MSNQVFLEKNIENMVDNKNGSGPNEPSATKKIIFDYDQLDYIKFRLTFLDGFNFGAGIIVAGIVISLIAGLILTILGASLSGMMFRTLM